MSLDPERHSGRSQCLKMCGRGFCCRSAVTVTDAVMMSRCMVQYPSLSNMTALYVRPGTSVITRSVTENAWVPHTAVIFMLPDITYGRITVTLSRVDVHEKIKKLLGMVVGRQSLTIDGQLCMRYISVWRKAGRYIESPARPVHNLL